MIRSARIPTNLRAYGEPLSTELSPYTVAHVRGADGVERIVITNERGTEMAQCGKVGRGLTTGFTRGLKGRFCVGLVVLRCLVDPVRPSEKHVVARGERGLSCDLPTNLSWKTEMEMKLGIRRGAYAKREPYSLANAQEGGFVMRRITELPGAHVGSQPVPYSADPAYLSMCGTLLLVGNKKVPLHLVQGRAVCRINGRRIHIHHLQFQLSNHGAQRPSVVAHSDDICTDDDATNLKTSNASKNRRDAHDNGCYNGTRTARCPVRICYKEGRTHEFTSMCEAGEWLSGPNGPTAFKGASSRAVRHIRHLAGTGRVSAFGYSVEHVDPTAVALRPAAKRLRMIAAAGPDSAEEDPDLETISAALMV